MNIDLQKIKLTNIIDPQNIKSHQKKEENEIKYNEEIDFISLRIINSFYIYLHCLFVAIYLQSINKKHKTNGKIFPLNTSKRNPTQ